MNIHISKAMAICSKFGFASAIPRDINKIAIHLNNMNKNRERLGSEEKKEILDTIIN